MILFSTDRQELRALSVSRFLPSGLLSYFCPLETARFCCDRKDVSCAVIDGCLSLSSAERLADDLHAAYPDLPMALIVPPRVIPNAPASVIRDEGDPDALMESLILFLGKTVGWSADLTTYALTLPSDPDKAQLLGYPFPLSTREGAILRCLFAFAPKAVPTDDLLDLCFPEGTQTVANLSVQISRINRRAANIGLPNLIVSEYGRGYRLNRAII